MQSYESAQNQKWEHIMNDWKQEKVKLMNALVGPSQNWIDIRKLPEQTILNETSYNGRSCLNNQEIAYAKEVYDYNKLVIEGSYRPNLVQKFATVAAGFNDSVIFYYFFYYCIDVTFKLSISRKSMKCGTL